MSTIDLTLLAQDTIDIKFSDEVTFRLPPEPTVGFTNKMRAYSQKMGNEKDENKQFDLLVEVTTLILEQDKNIEDIPTIVEQLHPSQILAIFNIYEDQTV